MGRRFFNPDTGIWRFFGWVGDIVILSLLWALCSIPLITCGAASTALYDSVVHVVRRKDDSFISRFFGTFRRELKMGCLSTLLWGAVVSLFLFLYRILAGTGPDGQVMTVWSVVLILLLYFILGILSWLFPILSRFTFGFTDLNRTALRLALGNILRSATMALLIGLGIAAFSRNFYFVFFVPGLASWLSSFLIEPVFEKYSNPE